MMEDEKRSGVKGQQKNEKYTGVSDLLLCTKRQ